MFTAKAGLDTNWRDPSRLTVTEAMAQPSPGAKGTSRDLLEAAPEATLVLSQLGRQAEGGSASNTVS